MTCWYAVKKLLTRSFTRSSCLQYRRRDNLLCAIRVTLKILSSWRTMTIPSIITFMKLSINNHSWPSRFALTLSLKCTLLRWITRALASLVCTPRGAYGPTCMYSFCRLHSVHFTLFVELGLLGTRRRTKTATD